MRHLTLLLMLLLLPACGVDFTGLESLDSFAGSVAESMEVAAVDCSPETLAVDESGDCAAANADGTTLQHSSTSTVIWTSSDNSVAAVDLEGHYTAHAVGQAVITGEGANGSMASDTVTVQ